ncbi:MAG: nicotinamide mononucleotide deamidase-related protein [Pyrodictiaceae archaeon]
MHRPKVWIINIGTELTIGRIVNTNGSWLARELTLRGGDVRRIVVVPDEEEEVTKVIQEAVKSAQIIITTGGLGPTFDDRTLEFIAKALGRRLVENNEALQMVLEKYSRLNLPLTEERRKMALLPEGGRPIPNPVGTAPGLHLVLDGGIHIFALPGVPSEMEAMFTSYVVRALENVLPRLCVVEESMEIHGVPESELAPLIKQVAKKYSDVYLKSHPAGEELSKPIITVKAMASADSCDKARERARAAIADLNNLLQGKDVKRVA